MKVFNLGSFGDGNPYTIFSHDLKSVLTSVPNGAWNTFNAMSGSQLAPTVDSELGTKFVDINGDDTAYRFTGMSAALSQVHNEGHIKISVERQWLCAAESSNNGNSGDVLQATEGLMSALASTAPAGTAIAIFSNGTSGSPSAWIVGTSAQTAIRLDYRNFKIGLQAAALLHTAGKERFVDVDIFWKGKYGFIAYDGMVAGATDLRDVSLWTNMWNNFYLGSDRGVAGRFVNSHYVKDMEIRTKCPEFSLNYERRQIGVLSDSIFDSESISASTAGDVSAQFRIQRKLNKQGQYCNITISEQGGYRIFNDGSNWLGDGVGIAASLTNNPVEVYISGGLNDSINATIATDSQFQAAYLDILEKLLGENGNSSTSTLKVKCITPTPLWGARNDADYAAQVILATGYRNVIKGMPALWAATYPLSTAIIEVKDVFTALGGESDAKGTDLYKGQLLGTLTDVHLGAHGMQIFGDAL